MNKITDSLLINSDKPSRKSRLFESGHMKLLVLSLIEQAPRYGYEIIKSIGELVGGGYSPSTGTIYPTLSYLEDMQFVSIEKQNKEEDKSKFKNNVVLTFKTEDGELKKVISYRFSEAEIRSQFKPGDYIKLEEISESKSNGKKERYYKLHHANERKELLSQIEQLQFELDILEEKYISDTQTIKSDKHRKDIWSKIKKDKVDQSLNDSFENNTKTAKEMDLKTKSLEDTADYFKPTTIEELLDIEGNEYKKRNLQYFVYDTEELLNENPILYKTPICRHKNSVTLGYEPEIWKEWIKK